MEPPISTFETAGYAGPSGGAVYVRCYVPREVQRGAIVIVPPDGEERTWSQRLVVNLARFLAQRGHPVVRFDFRGQGESDAPFENTDARTRLADLGRVLDWCAASGAATPVLVGLRLGANVAARHLALRPRGAAGSATATGAAPALIAIEPVLSRERYLAELLRKNMAHQFLVQKRLVASRADLLARVAAGGAVNCNGFLLARAFVDSLADLEWPGTVPPAWCVVGLPECGDAGSEHDPFWRESQRFRPRPAVLFERIAAAARSAPRAAFHPAPLLAAASDGRHPVTLDTAAGRAIGTFHPVPGRTRVAALVTNPGTNDRSSPHGLGLRLAQFLQARGVPTLRVDGRGAGESGGDDAAWHGKPTPFVHREVNVGAHAPAARAGLEWLREQGAREALVVGLCGGAVNGLIAAAEETGLDVRLVLLGMPILHLGPRPALPDEVMRAEFTRLLNKALDLAAIARFFSLRTEYGTLLRILAWKLRGLARRRAGRATTGAAAGAAPGPELIAPVIESWNRVQAQGVRTTFVFASYDALYPMFREHFPALADGVPLPGGADCVVLEGANHALTDRDSERRLMQVLERLLETPAVSAVL